MSCHFDQHDDCTEAGGSAMHGAIAEKSFLLFNGLRIKSPPAGRNEIVSRSQSALMLDNT